MSRISSNFRNLQDAVIRHSEADEWHSAVNEWIINDVEEDETLTGSCVCGKVKAPLSLYNSQYTKWECIVSDRQFVHQKV